MRAVIQAVSSASVRVNGGEPRSKAVGENFSPEELKAAEEEYTAALKPGEDMVDMGEVFNSEAMAGLKLN